jgi:hypothetical protein
MAAQQHVSADNVVSGHGRNRDGFAVADRRIHADALGAEPHKGPIRQGCFDHRTEDRGMSHGMPVYIRYVTASRRAVQSPYGYFLT